MLTMRAAGRSQLIGADHTRRQLSFTSRLHSSCTWCVGLSIDTLEWPYNIIFCRRFWLPRTGSSAAPPTLRVKNELVGSPCVFFLRRRCCCLLFFSLRALLDKFNRETSEELTKETRVLSPTRSAEKSRRLWKKKDGSHRIGSLCFVWLETRRYGEEREKESNQKKKTKKNRQGSFPAIWLSDRIWDACSGRDNFSVFGCMCCALTTRLNKRRRRCRLYGDTHVGHRSRTRAFLFTLDQVDVDDSSPSCFSSFPFSSYWRAHCFLHFFFFCISALRTVKEGACLISLIRRRRLFVVVRSPLGETLCQR